MRISDWSSDVCSSDLGERRHRLVAVEQKGHHVARDRIGRTRAGAMLDHHRCGIARRVEGGKGDEQAMVAIFPRHARSEERRVGKECVSLGRTRVAPCNSNQTTRLQNHSTKKEY